MAGSLHVRNLDDELIARLKRRAVRHGRSAEAEFLPPRLLLEAATRIAVELDHPAYDCLYLALASERGCRFVTADERFVRKLAEARRRRFRGRVISLVQAASEPDNA